MLSFSRRAALLLAPLACAVCGAQSFEPTPQVTGIENPQNKRYTVAGSVVNSATGEPIRRALVRVNGPADLAAFTGADGRFQIENVPAGQLILSAEKPGFFDTAAMSGKPFRSALTAGAATQEVRLQLTPAASVAGRVVDPDGTPIEGLQVELIADEIAQGRKQRQTRGYASTEEDGSYRFENLTPGRVFVRTILHQPFPFSNAVSQVYAPRYYAGCRRCLVRSAARTRGGPASSGRFQRFAQSTGLGSAERFPVCRPMPV